VDKVVNNRAGMVNDTETNATAAANATANATVTVKAEVTPLSHH
jgi:hypothetical protein